MVFETPVIFVAKPDNENGPIKGKAIHYIKGTETSYGLTRVQMPEVQSKTLSATTLGVHSADDEIASWVTLLETLQHAEFQSREWDARKSLLSPPRVPTHTIKAPEYELEVGLQSKTRSWDFIPASISKPYANTTICHLVEIISMLGLYWKVFDESVWNLRAEGNGFILTSTIVQGLGIMVVFAKTGKSTFGERRIIPCPAIKKLSFGIVPNIYSKTSHQELDLVFGKNERVSETLESIGCSTEMVNRFERDHKHIFSVSFEIIGMLGKVCRTRGSNFRFLPNPTSDPWFKKTGTKAAWNKAAWNIANLMRLFQDKLQAHIDTEKYDDDHQIRNIAAHWATISRLGCDKEEDLGIETREAIHDAVDHCTKYILSLSQEDVLSVLVAHITKVVEILDSVENPFNNNTTLSREATLIGTYFNVVRPFVMGDKNPVTNEMRDRNTIWITLVFRMLCWLLLHDFDKADVKIVPSALWGSRMPIYIS